MKKKITAIVTCLFMMLTLMPVTAFANGTDGMDIKKVIITRDNLGISVTNELYTGEPIKPEVYVEIQTEGEYKELTEGIDYTVAFEGEGLDSDTGLPQEIGWYNVVITGKGNYSGTVTYYTKFNLMNPMSIVNADIDFDDEYIYTGKPVVITGLSVIGANGEQLVMGEDYKLLYVPFGSTSRTETPPTEPGEYNLVVEGIGDYTGSCASSFEIISNQSEAHTHTFDMQIISDSYKASDATCIEPAKYYYSCECGEKGTEVFANGIAAGHNYKDGKCTVCGTADPSYVAEEPTKEPSKDSSKDNTDVKGNTDTKETTTPQTSDENSLAIWLALLIISGTTVAGVAVRRKY